MKHILRLPIVIGAIGLSVFAVGGLTTAHANQAKETGRCGDYGYSLNSDGTCNLEIYYGAGGTVTVPATLDGHAVYKVNGGCFVNPGSGGRYSVNTTINRLILPEGLKKIEDKAMWCNSMEYISLPASLETLGLGNPFQVGTSTEFYVDPGNTHFCSYEKSLFSKDMSKMYHVCLTGADYTVPAKVSEICSGAFQGCSTLVNLILSPSVNDVETYAFDNCVALSTVKVYGNDVQFWEYSFSNCPQLCEFRYGGNKLRLRHGVFWYDSKLADFYFGGLKVEYEECNIDMDQNEVLQYADFHYISEFGILWNEVSSVTDGVKLSWNGQIGDGISYNVYRCQAPAGFNRFELIKTLSQTEYIDKNVSLGNEYIYFIEQVNGSKREFTNSYSIQFQKRPEIIKCVNTVQGVHIYWSMPEELQKRVCYIYRSENSGESYGPIALGLVGDYVDTDVVSGTQYYYEIRISNELVSDPYVMTYVDTPDVTTRVNSVGGIRIYWNKINGATGYAIYRKGDGANDKWARVKTIAGNDTFVWTDSSTKPASCNGTVYHYTIRALAGADRSILSGCRSTGRTMVRLNKPVIYSMTKKSAGTVLGTWSPNDKATGYEVRFMVGTEVYKTFVYGDNTIVKKTISGLPTGKTYKIQVRSYYKTKNVGTYYSSWSDAVNVKL